MSIYLTFLRESKTIEESRFWLKYLEDDLKKKKAKHEKLALESESYSYAEGIHAGIFSFIENLIG